MSKKKFVCVSPLSKKAKNRFANEMELFHSCAIETEENDMFFLASLNRKYFFWVPKRGNEHWRVEK
jgi:hypothetical protein|tara:strand:+ start:7758 stop:7955 length:198 start_codon:yes stop_codon:yes gene_type:complete